MRKYLFNGKMIAAAFGAWTAIQSTRKGPRDWRLVLIWASWVLTMASAVGEVLEEAKKQRELN